VLTLVRYDVLLKKQKMPIKHYKIYHWVTMKNKVF